MTILFAKKTEILKTKMCKNLKGLRSSSLTWSLICILILKFFTQHNEQRKLFVGRIISHEIFKIHLTIFSGSKSELLKKSYPILIIKKCVPFRRCGENVVALWGSIVLAGLHNVSFKSFISLFFSFIRNLDVIAL